MRLAEIRVFPVKGLAGVAQGRAIAEACGLRDDRRWMVVDSAGRFLTQRALPQMAVIHAVATPNSVVLSKAGLEPIEVALPGPDAALEPVIVWRDTVMAADAGPEARDWISAALGTPARLVHLRDPAARPVSSTSGRRGETVSFADGFPVLLTSLDSLADLNARLPTPIPIDRFRGNLIIEGAPPWAEDTWRVIRVGGAIFRVAKPCDRCTVTTIDQATGLRPDRREPLRTLGKFRHDERGIMFGQNLVPLELGAVSVGDQIEVLERGPPNVTPLEA
jgi:uncharacterized protein YcbX